MAMIRHRYTSLFRVMIIVMIFSQGYFRIHVSVIVMIQVRIKVVVRIIDRTRV